MPTIIETPIVQWKAKRSGAAMTVEGVWSHDGRDAKLTNVVSIERHEDGTWAVEGDSSKTRLA